MVQMAFCFTHMKSLLWQPSTSHEPPFISVDDHQKPLVTTKNIQKRGDGLLLFYPHEWVFCVGTCTIVGSGRVWAVCPCPTFTKTSQALVCCGKIHMPWTEDCCDPSPDGWICFNCWVNQNEDGWICCGFNPICWGFTWFVGTITALIAEIHSKRRAKVSSCMMFRPLQFCSTFDKTLKSKRCGYLITMNFQGMGARAMSCALFSLLTVPWLTWDFKIVGDGSRRDL